MERFFLLRIALISPMGAGAIKRDHMRAGLSFLKKAFVIFGVFRG
ncbi:MAG: hypothetical protein ACI9FG_001450 [Crocinitomicaceae bacterium]|jgi:hypothetical protein